MLLLQLGLPGLAELVIILLILGLLAVPVLLVVVAVLYLRRSRPDESVSEERIGELEAEVERLRDQVADDESTMDADDADAAED